MANIALKDLSVNNITGADLFNDSESFMRDLSDDELNINGGRLAESTPIITPAVPVIYAVGEAAAVAVAVAIARWF